MTAVRQQSAQMKNEEYLLDRQGADLSILIEIELLAFWVRRVSALFADWMTLSFVRLWRRGGTSQGIE